MEESKTAMVALNPQNFHQWLKELKGIAEKAKVWEYIDPEGQKAQPESTDFPEIFDFQIPIIPQPFSVIAEGGAPLPQTPVTRPAEEYEELSDAQQKAYQMKITVYQMKEKLVEKVAHDMRIVDNALKASARTYIPNADMDAPIRDIIKALTDRYKRSDAQITQQIFEHFRKLQNSPAKQTIEKWIADWENLYREIEDRKLLGLYGNEEIFVDQFLTAGDKWAPNFCETWAQSLRAALRPVKFYETTREYRIAVERHLNKMKDLSVGMANVASLQGQEQQAQETGNQKGKSSKETWLATRRCVCGLIQPFDKCPHIVLSNRPLGWTESKKKRDEIRQQICMRSVKVFNAIKRISDTGILDGLTEESVGKKAQVSQKEDESSEAVAELPQYRFANTVYLGDNMVSKKRWNRLINSVIYDSGCNYALTHDKSRFRGEIVPEKDEDNWIDTPDGEMQVAGHGTMVVRGILNGQVREMIFPNTAYIPTSKVTLISANKLKREGFIWDMHKDTLQVKTTGQDICEIFERHGLAVVEYNHVQVPPSFSNPVQRGNQQKATPWHKRARGHCRPTNVINQLLHKEAWIQLGTQENQGNMGQNGAQAIENQGVSDGESPSLTSNQLATSETTSQHMTTPPPFHTRYISDGRAHGHDQTPIEDVVAVQDGPLANTNVTHRRRKRKKTQKETAALDVIGPTTTRPGSSADKGIAITIEGKRSRRPNPKHAQATWTHEIPKFHTTTFMAGIFKNASPKASNFHPAPRTSQHEGPDWPERRGVMDQRAYRAYNWEAKR